MKKNKKRPNFYKKYKSREIPRSTKRSREKNKSFDNSTEAIQQEIDEFQIEANILDKGYLYNFMTKNNLESNIIETIQQEIDEFQIEANMLDKGCLYYFCD